MNAAFRDPLVESTRGGPGGGSAKVTDAGLAMLRLYRSIEETAARAGAENILMLKSMLRDIPLRK